MQRLSRSLSQETGAAQQVCLEIAAALYSRLQQLQTDAPDCAMQSRAGQRL